MTTLTSAQQALLDSYLATLTEDKKNAIPNLDNVPAEYFCADEINANECAKLVSMGKKTATCSLKDAWTYDNEPLPNVGALTIVTDWHQAPVCIIKITEVAISKFKEVTPDFAQAEGEGDGSYEWWHAAHVEFFTDCAKSIGSSFNDDSELVLERFEKVYPVSEC